MQENLKNRSGLAFLVGLSVLAISAGAEIPAAHAQGATAMTVVSAKPEKAIPHVTTTQPAARTETARQPADRYYIEFRSRSALSYGHTFVVYGKLNARGETGPIAASQVVGFSPFTESPTPWMIGHVVPVPAEWGATDGDTEEQYVTARYRIVLNKAEYDAVLAYISRLKSNHPLWHAALYNCNAAAGDIARFMGLRIPTSTLQYPQDFITHLREINGGTQHATIEGVSNVRAVTSNGKANTRASNTRASNSGTQHATVTTAPPPQAAPLPERGMPL